jgi:hypothetical protein
MKYTEALKVPINTRLFNEYTGNVYILIGREGWSTPSTSCNTDTIAYYQKIDPLIDINVSYPHKFKIMKIFNIPKGRLFRASKVISSTIRFLEVYNQECLNNYIEAQKKIITQLSTYCKENIANSNL